MTTSSSPLDLLHDKRILITRGGGFNWHEADHFRIVYLPRIEVLKDATNKLSDFPQLLLAELIFSMPASPLMRTPSAYLYMNIDVDELYGTVTIDAPPSFCKSTSHCRCHRLSVGRNAETNKNMSRVGPSPHEVFIAPKYLQ